MQTTIAKYLSKFKKQITDVFQCGGHLSFLKHHCSMHIFHCGSNAAGHFLIASSWPVPLFPSPHLWTQNGFFLMHTWALETKRSHDRQHQVRMVDTLAWKLHAMPKTSSWTVCCVLGCCHGEEIMIQSTKAHVFSSHLLTNGSQDLCTVELTVCPSSTQSTRQSLRFQKTRSLWFWISNWLFVLYFSVVNRAYSNAWMVLNCRIMHTRTIIHNKLHRSVMKKLS